MNILTTCCLVLCCFLLYPSVVPAQYDEWHFGVGALFPNDPDNPRSGCLSTEEGCAVYKTGIYSTGDREYYSLITDGVTLRDQQCRTIQNGSGLLGHGSSTQSAVIVPHPGDTTQYFVFTAGAGTYVPEGSIGIRYSVVAFKPAPEVTWKNIVLLDTATEKLVAAVHCNNRDFWIVAHGWGDNKFYAWLVNSSGIVPKPVVSSVGVVHSRANAEYVIGHMKISPNGRKLVVVTNTMNSVQLFDFDNSTGVVSNPVDLPSSVSSYYGEYGASFSPNSTRLYISGVNAKMQIQLSQFTVTGTPQQIVASQQNIFSTRIAPGDNIGALQLGGVWNNHRYEGRIFCARNNSRYLGVIMQPDLAGAACNYVHDGYDLGTAIGHFGLPNCIDEHFNTGTSCYKPRAQTEGLQHIICAGETVDFYDASMNRPTNWKWLFPGGTPSFSTARDPQDVHYDKPGTYDVVLIATNTNGADTITISRCVTVLPSPVANAGADVEICKGRSVQLQASGGSSYEWTPATGLSDSHSASPVASPGTTVDYIVKVMTGECEDYDTVRVTVIDQLDALSGEYSICRGDTVWHDVGNVGMDVTYRWEPATGVSDPTARRPALVATQPVEYRVIVTGSNGCLDTATVRINILPHPEIDAGENIVVCRGSSIVLEVTGSPGTYEWEPKQDLSDYTSRTPMATPGKTTTYRVTVTGTNGCRTTDSVTVIVGDRIEVDAGEDRIICRGNSVRLKANSPVARYRWEPADGLDDPSSASPVASPTVTTTYRVTAIGADGCAGSDSVTVTVVPRPVLTAGPDREICEGSSTMLSVQGSDGDILWEPSTGLSDAHSRTPSATPLVTTVYTATLVNAGGCTTTASIRVVVWPKTILVVGQDTMICRGNESILSAVAGPGTYRWEPAETVTFPDRPVSPAHPKKTTMYTVTYTDEHGCTATDSMLVQVDEPADVKVILPEIEGPVGTYDFRVPVILHVSNTVLSEPVSLRFTVRYTLHSMEWTGISNGTIVKSPLDADNGLLTVTIDNINPVAGETVVAELIGTLLLAREDYTILDMEDLVMTPSPACVSVSGEDGLVHIGGVCFGRNIRRFDFPRIDMMPNPASDILEVHIHNTNGVTPSVQFLTLWGEIIPAPSAGIKTTAITVDAETSTAIFDVSSLANGVYYIAVEVDGLRVVQPLCIVR
jgi:PKD repeat protein